MHTKPITQTHTQASINLITIILAIFALSASAQLTIPLKPIPVTLQTTIVMIIGLSYTPSIAFSSTIGYILLGSIGAPIFTNFDSGIAKIMGPSGGYMMGFIFAATSMSYLRQLYGDSLVKIFLYSTLGTIIIYLCGITWLSYFIDSKVAIYEGCIKFIPSGIIKIGLVVAIMGYLRKK